MDMSDDDDDDGFQETDIDLQNCASDQASDSDNEDHNQQKHQQVDEVYEKVQLALVYL